MRSPSAHLASARRRRPRVTTRLPAVAEPCLASLAPCSRAGRGRSARPRPSAASSRRAASSRASLARSPSYCRRSRCHTRASCLVRRRRGRAGLASERSGRSSRASPTGLPVKLQVLASRPSARATACPARTSCSSTPSPRALRPPGDVRGRARWLADRLDAPPPTPTPTPTPTTPAAPSAAAGAAAARSAGKGGADLIDALAAADRGGRARLQGAAARRRPDRWLTPTRAAAATKAPASALTSVRRRRQAGTRAGHRSPVSRLLQQPLPGSRPAPPPLAGRRAALRRPRPSQPSAAGSWQWAVVGWARDGQLALRRRRRHRRPPPTTSRWLPTSPGRRSGRRRRRLRRTRLWYNSR